MDKKIESYIGFAVKAKDVIFGEDQICEKKKFVKLVLIDSSATDKFKERLYRRLQDLTLFTIDGLKDALKKENVNVIGIKNIELANAIINILR